jgi:hypothetical protein
MDQMGEICKKIPKKINVMRRDIFNAVSPMKWGGKLPAANQPVEEHKIPI